LRAPHYILGVLLAIGIAAGPVFSQKKNKKNELSYKDKKKYERLYVDASKAKILGDFEQSIKLFEQCLKINPNEAAAHYELGALYMQFGESESALVSSSKAAEMVPTNYYYRLLYAEILKSTQQLAEAAEELEKIKEDFPDKLTAYLDLSLIYVLQKEYQKAIATYDELEEKMGASAEIKLKKQYLYIQSGQVNKAAEEIEALIELEPDQLEYYLLLAEIYAVNGMEDKALKAYKNAAERFPSESRIQLSLAEFYRGKGQYKKALDHLKVAFADPNLDIDHKVKTILAFFELADRNPSYTGDIEELGKILLEVHPNDARVLTINGDIALNSNRTAEARKFFTRAVEIDDSRFPIWSQLMVLEADMNAFDTLLIHATQASELFPNQPVCYYFKGYAESRLEKHEDAAESYKHGASIVIDNDLLLLQFYLGMGDAYNESGEYELSDEAFSKALSLDSNNTVALNNYAYYLSLREEKLERALKMSARSNLLEPNQPTYLDTYAWIFYKLERYEEAREQMEKAIKYGGESSGVILEHMGDILYQLGDKDKAMEFWKKAIEKDDHSEFLEKKIAEGKLYE
jgi:tetratricopeptide (TPR) repeat protein